MSEEQQQEQEDFGELSPAEKRRQLKKKHKTKTFENEQKKQDEDFIRTNSDYEKSIEIESNERQILRRTLSNVDKTDSKSNRRPDTAGVTKLANEVEILKDENQKIAARSAEMRSEIEVLNYKHSNLNEELIESKSNCTTYLAQINALNLKLKGVNDREAQLQKRIDDLVDKVTTRENLILKNNLSGLYVANPDYDFPETQGSGELISFEAKTFVSNFRTNEDEKFNETFDRIINELETSRETISKLKNDLDSANTSLAKIQTIKEKIKVELEEHLKNEQELHQRAMTELKQAKSKSSNLVADNEDLTAEVDRLTVKIKGTEKMNERLDNAVRELREENRMLKKRTKGL